MQEISSSDIAKTLSALQWFKNLDGSSSATYDSLHVRMDLVVVPKTDTMTMIVLNLKLI